MPSRTTGINDIGIGSGVLDSITSGSDNIAIGDSALANVSTADKNIAIGTEALTLNNALGNTAIGYQSLTSNLTGIDNIGIGPITLSLNISGSENIAIGIGSQFANLAGNQNVSVGSGTLAVNTASFNVAMGYQALAAATNGGSNTAIGTDALTLLTTGAQNTALGINAGDSLDTGSFNLFLGSSAGVNLTGAESSNIYLMHAGVLGENNTQRLGTDGGGAGQVNTTIIAGDVASVRSFTATVGNITAALGDIVATSGNFILPVTTAAVGQIKQASKQLLHTYNVSNLFLGYNAGNFTTTGQNNVGIGYETLASLGVAGNSNTAVGLQSCFQLTTGSANTAIGEAAINRATTGSHNTASGYFSLGNIALTSGSFNTCTGSRSGINLTTSDSSNILIGYLVEGTAGDNNRLQIGVATGAGAGELNTAFIHGIYNITPAGGTTEMVIIDSNGQLGSTSLAPSTLFPWSTIVLDQTAAVNNGYFINKAGTLLLALPAVSAVGDVIEVYNMNTALGIQFTQAAGQQIFIGNTNTTLGAGGTLTSIAVGDSLKIVCSAANTIWRVTSMVGNWTPV